MFKGVNITSTTPADIESEAANFHGIYSPYSIGSEGDNTMLYIGADNKVYYPDAAMTIGACRAYFTLNNGLVCGEPNQSGSNINNFVLNFGDETNSIENEKLEIENVAGAWYDLSGRKLSGMPIVKGIYINNGHKVVIK